jgi:hypothetical protein
MLSEVFEEKGCRWIHVSHHSGRNRRLFMKF